MALTKFKEAYPNYRETFGDNYIPFDSFDVYTEGNDKIGSVKDAIIDDTAGRFRYLIVDTGFWVFGKQVLLPIGLAHFDYDSRRVYVDGLTKEQVENMPEYREGMTIDRNYEEQLSSSYRPLASRRRDSQFLGQETAATTRSAATAGAGYDYDREPELYRTTEQGHQRLRLYEEQLVANKTRAKAGEVAVGKHVETNTAQVSVPVEKERVVIERNAPTGDRVAANQNPDFREGEVARMDVYEESADIKKQAYVREEVDVHKEVDRDTVDAREKVRREELDIDTKGNPSVDKRRQ